MIAIIKQAVQESGLSQNEIAKRSKVSQGQLSRFMRGKRSLSLYSAAKLFEFLGLQIVAPAPKKPPKKR